MIKSHLGSHRWYPVVPLGRSILFSPRVDLTEVILSGIPHLVMQDDIYKGMFIPKGSVVIANALYAPSPARSLNLLMPAM